MSRMEQFEKLWSERHGVPAESMSQYRFASREGYCLPDMASHYRTFCETLDSFVVFLADDCGFPHHPMGVTVFVDSVKRAVEAAGGRLEFES